MQKTQKTKKAPDDKKQRKSNLFLSFIKWIFILGGSGVIAAVAVGAIAYATAYPKIPDVRSLASYHPKLPLRIYTADGILIGEYSEERRDFVPIEEIPQILRDALLAVEDTRFYQHVGVDFKGLARATIAQLFRPKSQGASTITMQLVRQFYLTNERTYTRKFYEILTALRIEETLSKDQILEIYMNQIFLGHRSYGFAAAAQTYFGKTLDQLTIAESAILAGLPQLPSTDNPITNPRNARTRQEIVLRRMLITGVINEEQYQAALAEPLQLRQPKPIELILHAEFAAEEAQRIILEQFGASAYTNGLNVYTTIQSEHQKPAYTALRNGLMSYELRQFYRGPDGKIAIPATQAELEQAVAAAIRQYPNNEEIQTAVVLSVDPKAVVVTRDGAERITINGKGLEPVKSGLAANARAEIKIETGSVVRIYNREGEWCITQVPQVEGAFVSLDSQTGAIVSMVGGFNFTHNKFNHVTQAWRQPGSSFKPFVYSAALEVGITPNTIINDAPITVRIPGAPPWSPKNFGGGFAGRVPMYDSFARSRNIPAILTIDAIGPAYAQQWIQRFGFTPDKHPANLTLTLGAGSVTPLQMASAFAVFANGGYQVQPYLISRITDSEGKLLYEYQPPMLTDQRRVISPRNAFVITNLLSGSGSGARRALGRTDIFGKTGTTNESRDTWFVGFGPTLTAAAWVGYDQPRSLGNNEIGGRLAQPIWVEYMKSALNGVPQQTLRSVPGVSNVGGHWVYDEFAGSGGVRILGDELSPRPEDIPEIDPATQSTIIDLFANQR